MTKERRRARFATQEPEVPDVPDYTDDVYQVVNDHEFKYLDRLETGYNKNKALGLYAQAKIYAGLHMDELDRLDPTGHLSVENGDKLPDQKNKKVDWGDV